MTDTERERINAICEVAGVTEIDDLSDGFHTFRQLYYQRMILFATIVSQNKDKAWKSLRHEDGELCFGGGWFIVGINTPEGSYTYHYENKYFDLFDCEILDYGKHWDGHTEKDVIRLLSLPRTQLSQQGTTSDLISKKMAIDAIMGQPPEPHYPSWYAAQIEKIPAAQPATNCSEIPNGSDDTISRQAAIDCVTYDVEHTIECLKALPPAQPEIIRCKDCKYRDENWRRVSVRWLPCMDVRTGSNWYCGSAERCEQDE